MMNGSNDKAKGKLAKLLLVSYALRRASYLIRLLAGGYLIYLMYQLFSEAGASSEALTPVMAAAGIAMILAGVYFVAGGLYALLNGIYAENDPAGLEQDEPSDEIQTEE